jgi:hypothetical protein
LLEAAEEEFIVSAERAFPLREKLSEKGKTFPGFCPFLLVNHRKYSLSGGIIGVKS